MAAWEAGSAGDQDAFLYRLYSLDYGYSLPTFFRTIYRGLPTASVCIWPIYMETRPRAQRMIPTKKVMKTIK
jgi:hypothetical protein